MSLQKNIPKNCSLGAFSEEFVIQGGPRAHWLQGRMYI